VPRNAFEGYDEPVSIDMEPEEALALMLNVAPKQEALESAKPDLD